MGTKVVDPLDVLRSGRPDSQFVYYGTDRKFAKMLPRIQCQDGFHLSVQAGELLYATPRNDYGPWTHVEVGYPSEQPEPWNEWSKYAESPDRPTSTVYAYVPFTMVEALIESHGGPA